MTPAQEARLKIKQALQTDCETMTAIQIADKYGWSDYYTRERLSSLGLKAQRAKKQKRTGAFADRRIDRKLAGMT